MRPITTDRKLQIQDPISKKWNKWIKQKNRIEKEKLDIVTHVFGSQHLNEKYGFFGLALLNYGKSPKFVLITYLIYLPRPILNLLVIQ